MMKINIFWFRRDLRLDDNHGLYQATIQGLPVLPVFIFDTNIISELPSDDPRITFIHDSLSSINDDLKKAGSSLLILTGDPESVFEQLTRSFDINAVYINKDYEPYALKRDSAVEVILKRQGIRLLRFRDQVIFEEKEIVRSGNDPYTIFTPYKKRWVTELQHALPLPGYDSHNSTSFLKVQHKFPLIGDIGFTRSLIKVKPYDLTVIKEYDKFRDFPSEERTSLLGPHLRFGTISIRKIVTLALEENEVFLGELIWREFFMQILYSFPHVVTENFKRKYDNIRWRNNEEEFSRWCNGETGYPMVDAGMRQLSETGYMHNRVRMIAASFLCKHLLVDWRWGEAWFALKLLDYELSSNNGNWQWAAGTGCDAVPYFRVFNPRLQQEKFDPLGAYVRKWIPEGVGTDYPKPVVDHDFARKRAIDAYRSGLR